MSKNRPFALCLAAAMLLSGCTSGGNSGSAAPAGGSTADPGTASSSGEASLYTPVGTMPITNEKIELTVLTQQIPSIIDMDTNTFTKWYEERTNIHINWQLVPQDAVEANLNLTLASNEYPDIFLNMGIRSNQEDLYGGSDKIFMPLNSLIDGQMTNFQKVLADRDTLKGCLTALDGNIYCLPSISEYTHVKYAQKMWVNTEWLKKLNLKAPETTEDFYQMLKAFKEKDPNGNGLADEVPLSGAPNTGGGWYSGVEDYIMNAFIYDSGYYQSDLRPYIHDGKIDVAVNKPEFKEGLKYLHKLYAEGLIDPTAFTGTNDQLKQLALNPDVPLLGAAPSGHPAMFTDIATDHDRYAMYDAIAPLKGPNGFQVSTRFDDDAKYGEAAIATTTKYPEAAARWLDGFYDYETQMCRKWGAEGDAWRAAEDGELGLGGKPALYKTLKTFDESAQNENWTWMGINFISAELMEGMTVTPADVDLKSADGFEKMLLKTTEDLYIPFETDDYKVVPNALRYAQDEAEERNTVRIDIENLAKEYRVQFITGDKDIDAEWDGYVKALDDMGLQRYLEIDNAAYGRFPK